MPKITGLKDSLASLERVKVQRGWKSYQTPLAEGKRIQYNLVKPHMALKEKTPAEASGIRIDGKNKWKALFENGVKAR